MCIICNADGDPSADAFLMAFAQAQRSMKEAAAAMHAVSNVVGPEHRARYDGIHKEMVRQIREWNKLEQKREHDTR